MAVKQAQSIANGQELGYAYMVLGASLARSGPDARAHGDELLDRSVEVFREFGAAIDEGRAHLKIAMERARRGDRERSEEERRLAQSLFADCGAEFLLKRSYDFAP